MTAQYSKNTNTTFITCIGILFLALVKPSVAQSVGASMSLEGRAAVTRACDVLLAAQNHNGSWQDSPPLTALAMSALDAVNSYLLRNDVQQAVGKSLAYIRPSLQKLLINERAIAIRPLLINHDEADTQLLKDAFRSFTSTKTIDKHHALWLADTVFMTAKRLNLSVPNHFCKQLAAATPTSFPQQLALAVALGNQTDTALKTLYTAARKTNCASASALDLYWLARACRTCNKAQKIPYDHWKADILNALLERQRGDGSWKLNDTHNDTQALQDTALVIQTIILCLEE